jgi:hypothetical protein
VLILGRGRTKTGQFLAYAADDRPWAEPIRRVLPTSTRPTDVGTDDFEDFTGIRVSTAASYRKSPGATTSGLPSGWSHVRRGCELATPAVANTVKRFN